MISDVMFDAINAVERYRRELPHVYADPAISEEIDKTLIAMRSLLNLLDSPPAADGEIAAAKAGKPNPEAN